MGAKELAMPRLGANDDLVLLAQWMVKEGEYVEARQQIAELESTKEVTELLAPVAGYIHLLIDEGDEVPVGTVVAQFDQEGERTGTAEREKDKEVQNEFQMTNRARQLAEEHNIPTDRLPKGKLIREKDILALIGPQYTIKDTKSNHLIIYGTGGFAREIINVARQTHAYEVDYVIGGVGDWNDKDSIMGVPVIPKSELETLYEQGYHKIVNAVAVTPNAFSRKEIYAALKKKNYDFPNMINNRAVIGENVQMGEGNIIFAGAVIGPEARLGSSCIINANATIAHEVVISDCCHIAAGAVLAGGVVVDENTLVGQGCTVYSNVHIGKNVLIHNGCHIYKDVPPNSVVRNTRERNG